MTAKLATQDEYTFARAQETGALLDGGAISSTFSEKPLVGSIQFEGGYLSPYFITDPERMEVAFDNAYILIHKKKINCRKDLLPLLEQIGKIGKPLLIIAEDVGPEVLAALVVNKLCGPLQVAAVRAPGVLDQCEGVLQEVALLTGGRAITGDPDIQLSEIQMSDLGQATKIVIDKHHTVVEGRASSSQACLRA
jgi:chaperonin GroEL